MESKKTADYVGGSKKSVQEKKTKSDTTTVSSGSSITDPSLEDIVVVGKRCSFEKSKSHESGYRLHECRSETALHSSSQSQNLTEVLPSEEPQPMAPTISNTSFTSAKSNLSSCDTLQNRIPDLEDKVHNQNYTILGLRKVLGTQDNLVHSKSVATEIDSSFDGVEDYLPKLKNMEKKICNREKKIKDLCQTIEECHKVKDIHIEENKGLKHQVNLLNRQLQSMYELIGKKNWNNSEDPVELIEYKNKTAELEGLVGTLMSGNKELQKKIERFSSSLESKEKELNCKAHELIEYKNRSTFEVCKLINQIDCLQEELKKQSQFLDVKIREAQNLMDDEIVSITQKLEEQYQKDLKAAIEKFQSRFEQLANLPKSAIDRLLQLCEPNKIDFMLIQKEWVNQQTLLENKIVSLQSDHDKEKMRLKDCYESKIVFLKTQVESLVSQLEEKRKRLDLFENEMMMYKTNSMNLLKASSKSDDLFSLKELYTAEIFSQKQVHKLQADIIEEKVKMLSEEILHRAKTEEIYLQELENAKKMAYTFREKYEQLVSEWGERMEKRLEVVPNEAGDMLEADGMFEDLKNLIHLLKRSEQVNEERIIQLQKSLDDSLYSYICDIEFFKSEIRQLEKFQTAQSKLDETIQDLINTLGTNYTKTIDTLNTSHLTELNFKKLEMYVMEMRYSEEIDSLKSVQKKEMAELQEKFKQLEDSKFIIEKELKSLRNNCDCDKMKLLKSKFDEISLELLKCEGMVAIKEETEQALTKRVDELENMIKKKEENCKKELEDLVARYLEDKILSSAKEDLAKELEDNLNDSELLLEKSCRDVDKLYSLCTELERNIKRAETFWSDNEEELKKDIKVGHNFFLPKTRSENLKNQLLEAIQSIKVWEEQNCQKAVKSCLDTRSRENELLEKCKKCEVDLDSAKDRITFLEKENKKILDENKKLNVEYNNLMNAIQANEKIIVEMELKKEKQFMEFKMKMKELEDDKNQILSREKLVTMERHEILERNVFLEESVRHLNETNDLLTAELANNKGPEEEIFSISLQEIRVLYEEEREYESEPTRIPSTSSVACQVESVDNNVPQCEKKLTNEHLLMGFIEGNSKLETKESNMSRSFIEDGVSNSKLHVDLSEVQSRNKLLHVIEDLENEKNYLKEKIEDLKKENYLTKARCEAKMKILEQKAGCSFDEDQITECKMGKMRREIEKLKDYIKTLNSKLKVMKVNNESLLKESHQHLRHNQCLVNELEEAWTQRYEIEDQLLKVRRENALLKLHRGQLEETNKKISRLVAEGKPSVVSWIKIHETVENIVDEVLALKTSFSDSGSASGGSTGFDEMKATSELKVMAETLHVQLENKTILCDELMVQKEILERELKGLEDLLKENDSRISDQNKFDSDCVDKDLDMMKYFLDAQNNQSIYLMEKEPLHLTDHQTPESTKLMTLSLLKKHLEDEVELGETQFRECLELELKVLKKEIQKSEIFNLSYGKEMIRDDDRNSALIEIIYEEEIQELTKEFEKEVAKLKATFASDGGEEGSRVLTKEESEVYLKEIEKLKSYFEEKWANLKERYQDIFIQRQKIFNLAEISGQSYIVDQFQSIFEQGGETKTEQQEKAETFVKEILKSHTDELNLLRMKYQKITDEIKANYMSEVQNLKSIINFLKEEKNKLDENWKQELEKKHQDIVKNIREEYEIELKNERKKFGDLLEEAKQTHQKEIFALEDFWTEKLSECETKCAIIKATEGKKTENIDECEESFKTDSDESHSHSHKSKQRFSDEPFGEGKQIESFKEEVQDFDSGLRHITTLRVDDKKLKDNFCSSCLVNKSYFKEMEVKTDDDKLEIVKERDSLRDVVSSLRFVIARLLSFIGQNRTELNNSSIGDFDETLYKSIELDMGHNTTDVSIVSNNGNFSLNLSNIIQEINDNSLLNSSDQVRFELEKCLKQLKKDAATLFTLSCSEATNQNLCDMVKNLEKDKIILENKVCKVEEMQEEIKKEISLTKEKLSQWERNLEVVSEGYGEEVVEPKKIVSLSDLKEKIKLFLLDQPQEINLLDEICKEGDRLQEEWKREKFDLQQQERWFNKRRDGQLDAADKQLHSFKKFIEEQAAEREQEREVFDKEINELKESLKAKERLNLAQNRTNREQGELHSVMSLAGNSVEILESQLKEINSRLSDTERDKTALELEFQNAVKKIWSLREVIQDLEVQLAEVSEKELNLKRKVEKLEGLVDDQTRANTNLKEELETCKNQIDTKHSDHIKNLEKELATLRHVVEQISPETIAQMKGNLREIERALMRKTKDLDQLNVSSANVSCSSPSDEVSLRDQLDATRCSTPDEMCLNTEPENITFLFEEVYRIQEKLARHNRAEEVAIKSIRDLKMQLRNNRKAYEEVQTERDVLLEKIDVYLKENSSLKVRLEEQRCNAGLLQKQLNANLESQISRLEVDVEKLNELCFEKDKQLRDMKEILENTTKTLKMRETEVLNKSKEESALISTLKTDLENAMSENQKLEKKLEKMKEKLHDSFKMPALIDSILEEKNTEIERLEKEVDRLSSEMSSLVTSRNFDSNSSKKIKQIKFSEPDSFGDCISSISAQNPSLVRNCSDSYSDFKNSPFRIRQPFQCSTKLESISSIGPLQLSPRGTDPSFNWKTSSPIVYDADELGNQMKSPSIKTERSLNKILDESKLRCEIESKQREISELQLEIDILKRQLVEANQELSTAKSQKKELEDSLITKDEEIKKLKSNDKSLLMTIETLKRNHEEEVTDLQNKCVFERRKVEKVYEEIKTLEVKKIEIEEAFLSLKEDYNEKLNGEQKAVEALIGQVRDLELKNEELIAEKENLEKEFDDTSGKLSKEILSLREENENLRIRCLNLSKTPTTMLIDAEVQVKEGEKLCEICEKNLISQLPAKGGFNPMTENFDKLKTEFENMTKVISEKNFSRKEAFTYAMVVRGLLSYILSNIDELYKELESYRKKVMECSVDDLAVKVKKELVLSAKLDNKLLSSIEGSSYAAKDSTPQILPEIPEVSFREVGGGDGFPILSQQNLLDIQKSAEICKELKNKIDSLERERDALMEKLAEQEKSTVLENSFSSKERILKEHERFSEDAKIMELLRINLEKVLQDLKQKEKDLKKEKQQRMSLEKEIKILKHMLKEPESRKTSNLNSHLESQNEKIVSLNRLLEEEKKKNKDLKLSLEEIKMERLSEKCAQRLLENDLALAREQKETLKIELMNTRKVLNTRNVEIGLLKRKVNLQEIDIKALSLSSNFQRQSTSEASSVVSKNESLNNVCYNEMQNAHEDMPSSLLSKMKQLNTCVQLHVKESNEMGEALLYLNQETEQMRDVIKHLEEINLSKLSEKTLVPDVDVDKRLWALEKEGLVMDIETLKKDQEILKRDLLETCKNNEILKLENSSLKRELATPKDISSHIENSVLQDRISHLTHKYLRAESYRKALAWQKNYLLVAIGEHRRSEEEAWEKICRLSGKKKVSKKGQKRTQRFRVAVLAIIAIWRMRYIVRRWQRQPTVNLDAAPGFSLRSNNRILAPLASVLNIYNEPVNPLSYQTRNIICTSSRILRTPPSRDPGLQGYSLDAKEVSDCLEKFRSFKENVGTDKLLP